MPAQGRPQAAGRSSQFQPGKYDIFPGRGMSNQKASQKQLEANQTSFLIARSRPNQASNLARQPGPCRELRKCSLFLDVQGEIDAWAASEGHTWNCAIYFASFVGGAVPAQGRPQTAGRSSQFQPGKYEIFQAGGCPTRKQARSQPEANQTSFFDSQKPAKPGKQRPDLARQPCRELRKCSLFRDVQGEIDAWAASQAHTWNCAIHFASFVGGAVPAQGRPQAAGRSSQFQPGRPDLARQPRPCRELRSAAFFGTSKARSTPGLLRKPTRAIYFASFVGGAVPAQGRPQAAGRSSEFQPGKYEPARSQPEANQTSFFDSQKPTKPLFLIARSQPNQASRGLIWQGSLAGS